MTRRGDGDHAAIAVLLSERFGDEIDRRRVWAWAHRSSLNMTCQPYPGSSDPAAVLAWYAAGPPARPGWGQRHVNGRLTGNTQDTPDVDSSEASALQ